MMSTEYRIASPHLAQFVQAIWRQAGSTAREAELVADHLVQASLAGHDSHGVGMIPSYMASLAQGNYSSISTPKWCATPVRC
jgi:Malate/L-lactate dehydrogenases